MNVINNGLAEGIVFPSADGRKQWFIQGNRLTVQSNAQNSWYYNLHQIEWFRLKERGTGFALDIKSKESPLPISGKIPFFEKGKMALIHLNPQEVEEINKALNQIKEQVPSIQIQTMNPAAMSAPAVAATAPMAGGAPQAVAREAEITLSSSRTRAQWIVSGKAITIKEGRNSTVVPLAQITSLEIRRNTISFKTASSNVQSHQRISRRTTDNRSLPYAELVFRSSDRMIAQQIQEKVMNSL